MNYLIDSVLVGIGATAVMDLWTLVRRPLLGVPSPDYGLVGRWFVGMARGRFHHVAIKASPSVRGERLIGWTAHYLTGVAFAGLLLALWGREWLLEPTLAPALVVGVGTVAVPFLLMQPGMGAGVAGRLTPNPAAARRQSLITHAIFGLGLYVAGWMVSVCRAL